MNFRSLPLLLLATLSLSNLALAQPKLSLRLFVIDNSFSMSKGSIEEVKKDLLSIIQNNPPTRRAPIGCVVFAGKSQPIVWFRNAEKAKKFANSLVTDGGGTSIAAGLEEAKKQILKYGSKANLTLVLWTDDGDGTPAETAKVAEELSQIFSSRKQQQLNQRVVIRSWSQHGDGADLQAIWSKNPDVMVTHMHESGSIEPKLTAPTPPKNYSVTVSAKPTGKVRWKDASNDLASYEIRWTAIATGPKPSTGKPVSVPLRFEKKCVCTLEGVPQSLSVNLPGTTSGTLEVTVPLNANEILSGKVQHSPHFHALLGPIPPRLTLSSASMLVMISNLPPPPPTETTIEMVATDVSEGMWYAMPNIACYHVTTKITVTGQMPQGTKIILQPPPSVRKLKLVPDTLVSGQQTIEILLATAVDPSPEQIRLSIDITPPADTPQVRFITPGQLQVEIQGPPPLRLIAGGNAAQTGYFSGSAFDGSTAAAVPVLLDVEGPVTGPFLKQLKLTVSGQRVSAGVGMISAGTPFSLPITLDRQTSQPYFVDSVESPSFVVRPLHLTPVIQDQQFSTEVRQFAPFKRHLLIGLTLLCALGTPLCILKLVRSLKVQNDFHEEQLL